MTDAEIAEATARCLNEVLGRGQTEADGEASAEDADALLTLLRRRYGLRLVHEAPVHSAAPLPRRTYRAWR